MKTLLLCFIALNSFLISDTRAQVIPADQSYKDSSFMRFKIALVGAVLDKSTEKLKPLLAKTVHVDRYKCNHADKLCLLESLDSMGVEANAFWEQMYLAIANGFSTIKIKHDMYGLANKGDWIYQAPAFKKTLKYENGVGLMVLGLNVNVREKPSVKSQVLTTVSYQELEHQKEFDSALTNNTDIEWVSVVTPRGQTGYISKKYVSLSVSREISVRKINGNWKIVSCYSPKPLC